MSDDDRGKLGMFAGLILVLIFTCVCQFIDPFLFVFAPAFMFAAFSLTLWIMNTKLLD